MVFKYIELSILLLIAPLIGSFINVTSTSIEETTESKHNITELPNHLIANILDYLPAKDIGRAKIISKNFKDAVDTIPLGSLSKIGNPNNFFVDTNLCKYLAVNYKRHIEIRELYVAYDVWKICNFGARKLPQLRKLNISFGLVMTYEQFMQQVNEMIAIFKDFYVAHRKLAQLEMRTGYSESFLQMLLRVRKDDLRNKMELVKEILSSGLIDINYKNRLGGHNALHYCLFPDFTRNIPNSYFNTTECVKMMVENKADVNVINNYGYSTMDYAALLTYDAPLKYLHEHGGNMNLYNKDTSFSVLRKILRNSPDCNSHYDHISSYSINLKYFLEPYRQFTENCNKFWAQYEEFDKHDDLPFKYLVRNGVMLQKTQTYYDSDFCVLVRGKNLNKHLKYLLENQDSLTIGKDKIDVNEICGDENSPLHVSIEKTNVEAVKLLIAHGANVNFRSKYGPGLLGLACTFMGDHLGTVLPLLIPGNQYSINDADGNGNTCLDYVNYDIKRDALEVLIEHEVDLNKRNTKDVSGLVASLYDLKGKKFGNKESIEYLVDNIDKLYLQFNATDPIDRMLAHLWILAVFRHVYDPDKRDSVLGTVPKEILDDLKKPYVDDNGLVFSEEFIAKPFVFYKNLLAPKNLNAEEMSLAGSYPQFLVFKHSPSLHQFVERVFIDISYHNPKNGGIHFLPLFQTMVNVKKIYFLKRFLENDRLVRKRILRSFPNQQHKTRTFYFLKNFLSKIAEYLQEDENLAVTKPRNFLFF